MKTLQNTPELNKLQKLCEIVNSRYASGLNDDDQVRNLFNYEKKIKDKARVIIGYDKYKALSISELKELKKNNQIKEDRHNTKYFEFSIVKNGMYLGRYKCNLPI